MSEWRGLHNPERHTVEASGLTSCRNCGGTGCSQVCPCWCCLDAEVDRLTAELNLAASTVTELQGLLDRIVCQLEERDERIARALTLMGNRANSSPGYPVLERVLRGESDE